jgi:hypothetical protein
LRVYAIESRRTREREREREKEREKERKKERKEKKKERVCKRKYFVMTAMMMPTHMKMSKSQLSN